MADTATLTLTDFLLARIAEDEAAVTDRSLSDWRETARFNPIRVLAECEAKRRILEAMDAHYHLLGEDARRVAEIARDLVLSNLAAVYADHPDYCDEWRP